MHLHLSKFFVWNKSVLLLLLLVVVVVPVVFSLE
jgi:hypothetical protein